MYYENEGLYLDLKIFRDDKYDYNFYSSLAKFSGLGNKINIMRNDSNKNYFYIDFILLIVVNLTKIMDKNFRIALA